MIGVIPEGCPLSMMFIVAMYLPWCRYLSPQEKIKPQLYAGNSKCVCGTLLYSCELLGSLLVMSVWSDRSVLLASLSSSKSVKKL